MNRLKLLRQTDPNYFPVSLIIPSAFGVGKLWLGDVHSLDDRNFFASEQVRTVLSCCKECKAAERIGPDAEFTNIVQLMIKDHKDEDIESHFTSTYDLIDKGRTLGSVLVHCMAGVSRSAAFVIAYMMRKLRIPYDEAYAFVKERRRKIKPNEGFIRQLQRYEISLGITKRKVEKENLNHNEKTHQTETKKPDAKPLNAKQPTVRQDKSKTLKLAKIKKEDEPNRRMATAPSEESNTNTPESSDNLTRHTKLERFKAEVAYFQILAARGQIYLWNQI